MSESTSRISALTSSAAKVTPSCLNIKADFLDDRIGAAAAGDTLERGSRFLDVGMFARKPTLAGACIGRDSRQRLVDLMHDRGRHLPHRHLLAHARHLGPRLAQRVALGQVAQEADEQQALAGDRGNRQLKRKLLAILADTRHLDAAAQYRRLAARKVALQSMFVGGAIALGNDQIRHRAPERLRARPAEQGHGMIVPAGNDAVLAHEDHGIERGLQHEAERVRGWRSAGRQIFRIGAGGHGRRSGRGVKRSCGTSSIIPDMAACQ